MWRVLLISLIVLLLVGCASRAELARRDDAKCRGLGLEPGTDAYAHCRMQAEQARATREAGAAASR